MIEAAAIFITLLGCSDDIQDCHFILETPATYVSQASCETAIPSILYEYKDEPYPVITAECKVEPVIAASALPNAANSVSTIEAPGDAAVAPGAETFNMTDNAQNPDGQEATTNTKFALVKNSVSGALAIIGYGANASYDTLVSSVQATMNGAGTIADRTIELIPAKINPFK